MKDNQPRLRSSGSSRTRVPSEPGARHRLGDVTELQHPRVHSSGDPRSERAAGDTSDSTPVDDGSGRSPAGPEAHVLPLLSVQELCRVLGIGRTTVFEEIHAGELQAIKIHRRTLFDQRDVADYLDRKRAAARRRRSSGPRRRTLHGLTS